MELVTNARRCSCPYFQFNKRIFVKQMPRFKNWPPNSPDLNPIENLWGIMGRRISKESPNSERKLELIVRKVWKNIEWEVIENLINSMEKRLRLVVELNGESINGYF
ncbi:transposable element tc1 transposase [Anaeramoeba flamelloides]|uniref:Transposable element tc1 transposase n=1 Tax=Anaeramoeba flamelloides TaxID=1746091 RepID=A0ABQ8XG91_9EUKA|nr:transposable element tc1 transposase [Anaeramoeba flamelloides]